MTPTIEFWIKIAIMVLGMALLLLAYYLGTRVGEERGFAAGMSTGKILGKRQEVRGKREGYYRGFSAGEGVEAMRRLSDVKALESRIDQLSKELAIKDDMLRKMQLSDGNSYSNPKVRNL